MSTPKKMMTFILEAKDGVQIKIEEDAAFQSNLIKKMVEDLGIEDANSPGLEEAIPVHNLDGWTLQKIVDFCVAHRGEVYKPREDHEDPRLVLSQADKDYLNVSSAQLLDLLMGSNYLDIPGLHDIITQKIANMADGHTLEEMRTMYCIENDFTPEEEEEIRKRFEWVEA